MKNPNRLVLAVFIALVVLIKGTACSQPEVRKQPNVIVILSDDAGYVDFGVYGGKEIPTPNIDAIAKNGTLFTNGYVTASVCAPSRAGLLTGRYQQRFGFEHNTSEKPTEGYQLSDVGMDPAELTIGDEMQGNGYKTIAIGKWHMGKEDKHFPLNRGFDEFYGFVGGHRDFFAYKTPRALELALYNNREVVPEEEISYLTDMFTDKAMSFIKENKERPFFMYLAYNAVHTPLNAKTDLMDSFSHIPDSNRRAYAAMMTSMDNGVGNIMQLLNELKLTENTLVIFTNDNGAAIGNASDNGHLRGMKGSKWEGGIRVAYMMQWPGHVPVDKIYNHPVSTLDILPTSIAAAGGKQTGSKPLDGKDLIPYLESGNAEIPHEDLFWRRGIAAAVRSGNWKLIRSGENPILLFDLEKDLSETNNLAERNPEKVKELLGKLGNWEKGIDNPHWISTYGDYNQIMKHRMEVKGREMEELYP